LTVRLLPAVAVACGCAVAACTSGHSSGAPSSSAQSSSAPASSASPSSASPSSASAAPTGAAQAQAALLTGSDLGPGFVKQAFPGGTGAATTTPCLPAGSPSLDRKYPPSARAQVGYGSNAPQAVLGEQVALYRDAATADGVMSYARRALSCSSATVQGQKVRISASAPTQQVGSERVDTAQSWQVNVGPAAASIVAVRLGNAVISMEFVALSTTDLTKLPKEETVVALAVKRARSALF
jgi:hypothetical protein